MKLMQLAPNPGVCRLRCAGHVTVEDLDRGQDPLGSVLGKSGFASNVLLEMMDVDFIDSAGIAWLINCHQRFRQAGGRLVIHSMPPQVDNVFKLLRMPSLLSLARDEAAARAMALEEMP
jgi:anti-anti-sigma factor